MRLERSKLDRVACLRTETDALCLFGKVEVSTDLSMLSSQGMALMLHIK